MKWRRLVLLSGSLLAALVVADVAVTLFVLDGGRFRGRPLPPFGATPHPRQLAWVAKQRDGIARGIVPGAFDRELGWVNRAGAKGPKPGQTFNSIGARGSREYAPAAPEGVLRAVVFGDSFTYGSEVPDGDDWPARIEAANAQVEVLNFGVGGYGTDQSLLRFRREGLHGARVAAIGLLVENVARNVNRYRPTYFPRSYNASAKPRFVLVDGGLELVPIPFEDRAELVEAVADGSIVETLGEHEFWAGDEPVVPWSSFARLLSAYTAYSRRQPERLWADVEGEPCRVTIEILAAFHREALAAGAERAVVLIFPREDDLERLARDGEPYWGTLHAALDARGIPYVDLARDLLGPWGSGDVRFVQGHLDGAGNGVVAARVLPLLFGE